MNVELCVGPGVLMAYCECDLACCVAFQTRICRIRSAHWRAGRKSMVLSIANHLAHRGVHGSESTPHPQT